VKFKQFKKILTTGGSVMCDEKIEFRLGGGESTLGMIVVFLDLWFKLLYIKYEALGFLTMHILFRCAN
jgi:hypothetical protein